MRYAFNPQDVTWVLTEDDLGALDAAIRSALEVVIDLETTGLDEFAETGGARNGGVAARVVLASLTLPVEEGTDPTTWVLPLSHPDSPWRGTWRKRLRSVASAILESGAPVINQNMKFDSRWIYATTGVDLSSRIVWDTRLSSHMLDENSSTKLKERAPATFPGLKRWDDFDLTTPGAAERVPMFDLGMYAARDTYWTWALAQTHREQMYVPGFSDEDPFDSDDIENARLGRLAIWCSMPTVATLTAMEQRGIYLDVDWVEEAIKEDSRIVEGLQSELVSRYPGLDPEGVSFAATSHWFKAWIDAAVKAGDLRVTELTPGGVASWGKGVLLRQARQGSQVATDLLEMRAAVKRLEYLHAWLGFLAPDGAIHTNYNAGRTVTGRLSSDSPNMQQVTGVLKPAFVPPRGYVAAELDYSQIELRIAAFVARCQPMIEAFRRGDDVHRLFAARITQKPAEEVLKNERQSAKAGNFGLLYGMSASGFRLYAESAYDVVLSADEATAIHREFFRMWDGMAQWHATVVSKVRATGQVVSPIGRVRRLPDVFSADDGKAYHAERSAINAPVQGFASDLMQMAAASIEGNLPGYERINEACLVGTVHDSLVVYVPEDNWRTVVRECAERMVGLDPVLRRLGCHLDVPLAVEAKVGTRWGLSDVGVLEFSNREALLAQSEA